MTVRVFVMTGDHLTDNFGTTFTQLGPGVYEAHDDLAIVEAVTAARRDELRKAARAVCFGCGPGHVMDDGQLWGLCLASMLTRNGVYTEAEIAAALCEGKGERP